MARIELLNNVDHKDLRVKTGHGAEFGDCINQTLVFPTEYGAVQREYPIFFIRDVDDAFQSVALLGFDKDENLYLDEAGWRARYVPAIQERGPFMIGLRERSANGSVSREPMIQVDLDHARIGDNEGEKVFLPHGGNSPYLERVTDLLRCIYEGAEIGKAMFAAFEEAELIEPVTVEIKLSDVEQYNLPDHYTVNEERLLRLDGASLEQLNRTGFLRAAYHVLSSLGNVNKLIEMKNRKRAGVQPG